MQCRQFALEGPYARFEASTVAVQIVSQRGSLGVFFPDATLRSRRVCFLKRHHEICELSTNVCEAAFERGGGLRNRPG